MFDQPFVRFQQDVSSNAGTIIWFWPLIHFDYLLHNYQRKSRIRINDESLLSGIENLLHLVLMILAIMLYPKSCLVVSEK